jgi:hypothetical protein
MPRHLEVTRHGTLGVDLPRRRCRHRYPLRDRPVGRSAVRERLPLRHFDCQLGGLLRDRARDARGSLPCRGRLPVVPRSRSGFIGGLTTYSSFNYETSRLLEEGAAGSAMVNALATIPGAFVAGWLGMVSARLLLGR